MPSEYLAAADYAEFGLAGPMGPQVRKASALIDSYLNRSEGIVWAPDSLGRPAYMVGLDPTQVITLTAAVAPGAGVVVSLPYATYDLVGEVFMLDRSNTSLSEVVTVSAVNPSAGTITLARVLKAHASGALLEAGLTITEDRQLPQGRSIAQVSRPNLTSVLSALGRYGYGRRSDHYGLNGEMNLLATLQTLGVQQVWQPIDVSGLSISSTTGEVWITPGLALAYFSEARLRYVAGFPANAIPRAIKQATANVMANVAASDDNDASPIWKVMQAGGSKLERFTDTYIDGDTLSLLSSYKTRLMV